MSFKIYMCVYDSAVPKTVVGNWLQSAIALACCVALGSDHTLFGVLASSSIQEQDGLQDFS